jgi:hypothetical protein
VGDIIVRHGKDRNLSDRSITALNTAGTLVNGRQVSVHITGVTTTTGNFFSGSGNLSKGITVSREISHDNQDVLLELVGVVLGSGQGKTRSNDTLNPGEQLIK